MSSSFKKHLRDLKEKEKLREGQQPATGALAGGGVPCNGPDTLLDKNGFANTPEPEGAFWVEDGACYEHGEYEWHPWQGRIFRGLQEIQGASTPKEAQRLVEQDMERGYPRYRSAPSYPEAVLRFAAGEESPAKAARPSDSMEVPAPHRHSCQEILGGPKPDPLKHPWEFRANSFAAEHGSSERVPVISAGLLKQYLLGIVNRQDAADADREALTQNHASHLHRLNDLIKALEKRVGELADSSQLAHDHATKLWAHASGVDTRFKALEAKAKDPEPVSGPYKLPYAERLERMVCAMLADNDQRSLQMNHAEMVQDAELMLWSIDEHLAKAPTRDQGKPRCHYCRHGTVEVDLNGKRKCQGCSSVCMPGEDRLWGEPGS